jgi:hypothetical protein
VRVYNPKQKCDYTYGKDELLERESLNARCLSNDVAVAYAGYATSTGITDVCGDITHVGSECLRTKGSISR